MTETPPLPASNFESKPPAIGEIPEDRGVDFEPNGQFYRLEKAWTQVQQLGGVFRTLILSGILAGVAVPLIFSGSEPWIRMGAPVAWLSITLLSLTHAIVWPILSYRRYLYRVDESRLQLRRGVLWREVLDVPRNRIQHTDVGQGPIERQFGISHLIVHTAGTTSASVRLPGLREDNAYKLRDELLGAQDVETI